MRKIYFKIFLDCNSSGPPPGGPNNRKEAWMKKARIAGIAVALAGVLLCAGGFFLSEDFTPDLGLRWNLKNMQVVLQDYMEETFMDISAFRERYPQYADLDDQELAARLHARYFSGKAPGEYRKHFLRNEERPPGPGEPGGDPLDIRGDISDIRPKDPLTRSVMTSDAIEFGLLELTRHRVAFPYRHALFAGLGIILAGIVIAAASQSKRS